MLPSILCFSSIMAALFGPAAADVACRDTEGYCERFGADECDTFSLHQQCPLLCGGCTLAPTATPTVETPAGIFRSGLNLNVESASGGDVSINGYLWHDVLGDNAAMNSTIATLVSTVEALRQDVLNQAATITEQGSTIARLENAVDEQGSTILRLENTVEEQGTEMRNLTEQLTADQTDRQTPISVGNASGTLFSDVTIRDGNLVVPSDATSLDEYDHITHITGSLFVRSNVNLQTVTGFGNLLSIENYLYVGYNANLQTITGFGNLLSIEDYLYVRSNVNLQTITGFGNLESIGGYLNFDFNLDLQTITGFGNLQSIGGYLLIHNSTNLQNITGFGNLQSVGGYLRISNNDVLNFEGAFPSLTCHGGVYQDDPSSYCQGCPQGLIDLPRC